MIALQYGDGNFLRGFVDWMIHEMNVNSPSFKCDIIVLKARAGEGLIPHYKAYKNTFTVHTKGFINGESLMSSTAVSSISDAFSPYDDYEKYRNLAKLEDLKLVFSNTTEAGMFLDKSERLEDRPPQGFVGKLTQLLFYRYEIFKGDLSKGLIIVPCELLQDNGKLLHSLINQYIELWQLPRGFNTWLNEACHFCNTLVDRIITSPNQSLDSTTNPLDVQAEPYHLFVIQDNGKLEPLLPTAASKLNIIFSDNLEYYRKRKVRILNGAHTTMVAVGYLLGLETVKNCMDSPLLSTFIEQLLYEEICPSLPFPQEELLTYANEVLDRFRNPFLEHKLLTISLNSISKSAVRIVPSIKSYLSKTGELPQRLCFALAALFVFYNGRRSGNSFTLSDTKDVMSFFSNLYNQHPLPASSVNEICPLILANEGFWGEDLNDISGLTECVSKHMKNITSQGMNESLQMLNF